MDDLRLAWKNLWRNRRRTLITLAAIAVSITLMQAAHNLSFGVYASMIDRGVRAGSGHLSIYRQGYLQDRDPKLGFNPQNLAAEISRLAGVESVLPRLYLPGLAQSSRDSRGILLTGTAPVEEYRINPFLRKLPATQMIREGNLRDALVGQRLFEELKLSFGGKFVVTLQGQEGELASELLRVRGIFTSGIKDIDRSLVLVDQHRAATMRGRPQQIHELAIILKPQADERWLLDQIGRLLKNHPQLILVGWQEAMANLADAIRLDYAAQKFIFLIIILIVTIGVINTLLMSVMERIPEFGVILALGAPSWRLQRMLLTEALLLGVIGMLLGSFGGSLATWYLRVEGLDLRYFVSSSLEFGGVVFDPIMRADWDLRWMLKMAFYVCGLALLAAWYPARKAGKISPAGAMRHY